MTSAEPFDAALATAPTGEIARQLMAETRELIQLEVRLAKAEAKAELGRALGAVIAGAVAMALLLLGLSALLMALVLALGDGAVGALVIGLVLLALAAGAAAYAYLSLPKSFLSQTRDRLKDDLNRLKEHAT